MDKRKLIAALKKGLAGETGQLIGLTQKQIAATLSKELNTNISPRTVRHYLAHLNQSRKEEEKLPMRKRGRPSKLEASNSPNLPPLDHLLALELSHISGRSASHTYHQLNDLGLIKGSKSSFHAKIESWLTTHTCSVASTTTPNKRADQHPILSRYSLRVSATVLEITPDYLYQVYLIGYEAHTGYLQILPVEAISPEAQLEKRSVGRPKKSPETNDCLYRQSHDEVPTAMYLSRSVLTDCIQNFIRIIGLPIHDITLIDSPTISLSYTSDGNPLDTMPFNLVSVEKRRSLLEEYLNRKARSRDTIFELALAGIDALNEIAIQKIMRDRNELRNEFKLGDQLIKKSGLPGQTRKKLDQQRIALTKAYKDDYRYFARLATYTNPKTKRIRLSCPPHKQPPHPADC